MMAGFAMWVSLQLLVHHNTNEKQKKWKKMREYFSKVAHFHHFFDMTRCAVCCPAGQF
jgi:hypothetical protein